MAIELHPLSPMEMAQVIMDTRRSIVLDPVDIALLVLMRGEIDADENAGMSLSLPTIRALHSRLDALEGKEQRSAERRLGESMDRLETAGCIGLSDIFHTHRSEGADYQLTAFGDAVYSRQVQQSEFSGEPLTAIFRAFIALLDKIVQQARLARSQEDWDYDVLQPMQHALRAMLEAVQAHQKELDRQHAELRNFLPDLMNENSEESIVTCRAKLDQVFHTIVDLQTVVLSSGSAAHNLIDELRQIAGPTPPKRLELACEESNHRILGLERWTGARSKEWIEHHNIVHAHLRSNILIDRNRRITEAVRQAILQVPNWRIVVADECAVLQLRPSPVHAVGKEPPRLARALLTKQHDLEWVEHDALPDLLLALLAENLETGEAYLSRIMAAAYGITGKQQQLAGHFPWLVERMLAAAALDREPRTLTGVSSGLVVEELRVFKC